MIIQGRPNILNFLLVLFLYLTTPHVIFAQNADFNSIHIRGDYWLSFNNAPHSLYNFVMEENIKLLDERAVQLTDIHHINQWKKRQKWIKHTLNEMIGPFPEKTPLNAQVQRVITKKNFKVEQIVFESQPGFYVTASFFLPQADHKLPTILFCSGHSMNSYRSETYQQYILNLVDKGFAVFAFDPIGQGERIQYYDSKSATSSFKSATKEHSYPGTQALLTGLSQTQFMVWDGIRALDYLFTRNEVDTTRIGITGASGGGTQSALIAALDDRIYAAAPERYITNFKRLFQTIGPTDAEQSVKYAAYRGIDHGDLLSVRAPKPTLIVSTINDYFSIQGAYETFSEVSNIFRAYNAQGNFQMAEDMGGHISTRQNREAIYAFFQEHLANPGDPKDIPVSYFKLEELQVTRTGQVSTTYESETVFSLNRQKSEENIRNLNSNRKHHVNHLEKVKENARQLSGMRKQKEIEKPVLTGKSDRNSYTIERYYIKGEGNYVVPYLLFIPNRPSHIGMIYLHPDGKSAEVMENGEIEYFVQNGITVLVPDLIGIGEVGPGHLRGSAVFDNVNINIWYGAMIAGRSIVGIRAGDVIRLHSILNNDTHITEIFGFSRQEMSSVLLHATLDANFSRIALVEPLASYSYITGQRFYDPKYIYGAPVGVLEKYDLPDLAACLAPKKLLIVNSTDAAGNFVESPRIEKDYEIIKRLYDHYDASDKLNILSSHDKEAFAEIYQKWIK